MWTMILKMSAATLIYVAITAGLWFICHGKERSGTGWKLLIGLIYGACSVAANHIGIDYSILILNVRDIGPLAAGLFFSPMSGIIAGIIGGGERILAGELWHIGQFTELACGMSTCLAGLIAALLNRKVYEGQRPPVVHAFFLGAVTEVFHMYAVLFTNRNDMTLAYEVVKTATVPMIVFTAIGTALCSVVILRVSGEKPEYRLLDNEEKIPLTVRFQRRLMAVTVIIFLVNFWVSYVFQSRMADVNASGDLSYILAENVRIYRDSGRLSILQGHLKEQDSTEYWYLLVDAGNGTIMTASTDLSTDRLVRKDLEEVLGKAGEAPFRMDMATFHGIRVMGCSAKINEDVLLVVIRSEEMIYRNRDSEIVENTLSDILLFTVLYVLVSMLMEALVTQSLKRVNVALGRITDGHLDQKVWVRNSSEFSELSDDINKTVAALRGYIDQAEQRMQEELKLAQTIQDAALPKNFDLGTENLELYAIMTPAKQVGGDFYDFFYTGTDKLCVVIADVSGKGVPAALFMMRAMTSIRNFARHEHSPGKVLENVNRTLCEGNNAEMFVTVWLGILDLKSGKMACANAGHEYPVLMRAGGDYELLKDRHGLPLAVLDDIHTHEYAIDFAPGDRLFIYTDGVPEAINEKVEAYGTERMAEKLNKLKTLSQEKMLEIMLRDIRNFAGGAEQFDDITMLGFAYGTAETAACIPDGNGT